MQVKVDKQDVFDSYCVESIFGKCASNFKKGSFRSYGTKGEFRLNTHRVIEAFFYPALGKLELRDVYATEEIQHKITIKRFDFIFTQNHESNFAKFCICFSDFREHIGC